jgi:hypothetical protein
VSTSAGAVPPEVDVAIVGEAANADVVGSRVASWFHGQSTVARTTRLATLESSSVLAPIERPGVHVWIVVAEPTSVRVFFALQDLPGQATRYLVSSVPLESGLDELGIEQLAQVVYLSTMALWAGNVESSRQDVQQGLEHVPSVRRASAPLAAPLPPVKAQVPSGRMKAAIGFEYAVVAEGDEGVAQSLGGTVAVLYAGRAHELGGRIHAGLILPQESTKSGIELELRGATFGLGVAGVRHAWRRLSIPGEVGLAVDVVHYQPGSINNPALAPSAGGLDVRPLAYARCGARLDLGPVALELDALLRIQLLHVHYDVLEEGNRTAVIIPWPVQPGFAAEASW